MRKFFLASLSLIFLIALLSGAAAFYGVKYFQTSSLLPGQKIVFIKPGSGFQGAVRTLEEEGVITEPLVFKVGSVLLGKHKAVKAGEYQLEAGITPLEVLEIISSGKFYLRKVTIPEGFTSWQVLDAVGKADALEGDLLKDVKEGSILPDTYLYQRGDKRTDLIKKMQAEMQKFVDVAWEKRSDELPIKTKEEVLTLASIVEKETAVDAERPKVAGVYINRLTKGMKLEADPTVIYGITKGMGELGRPLYFKDLEAPTPYNTYANVGLPPAPIANPGRKSILAVMNPEKTTAIYFVADGSGGHVFADTFKDHQKNVAAWREIEKARKEKEAGSNP